MIKIEKTVLPSPEQWEIIIEGMRNPKNSWDRMDSYATHIEDADTLETADYEFFIGENDHKLMMQLANGGPVHAKYRRMIPVYVTINAPLYWWKEFDTYKVGTVTNSCSTMHKIHEKPFSVNDISCDELQKGNLIDVDGNILAPELKAHYKHMMLILDSLNNLRDLYLKTDDKRYWRCMIEMLPSSYNQKRTVMLNYEVLVGMYRDRKNHKLDEWHDFCDWIESLPYRELICGPGYLRKKMNIPTDAEGIYKEAIEAMTNEKEEK